MHVSGYARRHIPLLAGRTRWPILFNPTRPPRAAIITREIGIRMALGAGSGAALRMILREGLVLTAISSGIGSQLGWLAFQTRTAAIV